MSYEPVSSYPKPGRRHFLWVGLCAAFGATLAGFALGHTIGSGQALFDVGTVGPLIFLFYGAFWFPYLIVLELGRPKVRIGPDWIESYYDHHDGLRRESLDELERVSSEDESAICFELVDGREFWIRRKHVGHHDWQALREELAYRLDFYETSQAAPSTLASASGRG